eukprot:TRINITY_DN2431_c0_g4_i1.p1 TRINITY_DN2431_c0_g4~~TRINITY_DN2431_c0_g4_i1.p1  ORF type:complete len:287 (+),score=44.63 TRINITY_DN2431_c0_g4_i1:58-861(+)
MAPVAASDSNGVAVSKRAARVSSPAPRTAKEDDKTTTVAGIAAATCPGDEDVALKHGAEEPVADSETATYATEVPQDVSRFARLKAIAACCGSRRVASMGMVPVAAVAAASAHRMGVFDSMTAQFVHLAAALRAQPHLAACVVGLVLLLTSVFLARRLQSSTLRFRSMHKTSAAVSRTALAQHIARCRGRYGVLLVLLLSVGFAVSMIDAQTLVGLKSTLISHVGVERTQQACAILLRVTLGIFGIYYVVTLAGDLIDNWLQLGERH